MKLPSSWECRALMAEYDMLPHIREHSFMVRDVAVWLGQELIKAGFPLHLSLIEVGALLHDLGKTPCLKTGDNHAEWGARVLVAKGYPEVADIVREHVYLDGNRQEHRPFREAELVNYADKRVLHTRVVTLAQRFADLKERYGRNHPERLARIRNAELMATALEARLFQPLTITPGDVLRLNERRPP